MTGTYFRVETWHSSYKGKRDSNKMRTKSYFCLKRRHSLCTLIYLHPTKVGILIFILFLVKYRVPLNTVYLQMQRWRNTFWCLATNLLKNRNGLDGFLKRSSVVYFFFFPPGYHNQIENWNTDTLKGAVYLACPWNKARIPTKVTASLEE